MKYFSVCSGIEAATLAWHPMGWEPVGFSEIEKFPSAVLAHHYPGVKNYGDMTKFKEWTDVPAFNVLVGGTPCQSFSVAGLRKGLADPRGNLALVFLGIADKYKPEWVVWENVPGVLSSLSHDAPDPRPPEIDLDGDGGPGIGEEIVVDDEYDSDESHAFGCFLAGLSELGYGVAYGVRDAQYTRVDGFGRAVPQRRRRVFVIGHLGDWRRAAAVLFERESLCGYSPPRRQAGQGSSADAAPSIGASGRGFDRAGETRGQDPVVAVDVADTLSVGANQTTGFQGDVVGVDVVAKTLMAKHTKHDPELETYAISHALRGDGFDASEDGTGRGTPIIPVNPGFQGDTLVTPEMAWQCLASQGGNNGGGAGAILIEPAVYSITPSNSNKDYNARVADKSQAITTNGNRPSARGGDLVVTADEKVFAIQATLITRGENAAQGGPGVSDTGEMYTLTKTDVHAIATPKPIAWTEELTPSEDVAGPVQYGGEGGRHDGVAIPPVAFTCKDHGADADSEVAPTLRARGHADSHANAGGQLAVVLPLKEPGSKGDAGTLKNSIHGEPGDPMFTLKAGGQHGVAVAFTQNHDVMHSLSTNQNATGRNAANVAVGWAVRRLTPRECERLQGCPDDYTLIPIDRKMRKAVDAEMAAYYRETGQELSGDEQTKLAADGPRYKALGNSMAVNVMRWIGRRIEMVDAQCK